MINKKTSILLIVMLFTELCFAQKLDFKSFLINNKFVLIKIMYNNYNHTADIDAGVVYPRNCTYRAKFEMRAIIYDTLKVEHKKLLKNLKFSVKDTVLIYDWDQETDPFPANVAACKFKYFAADSTLIFFNAQDISRNYKLYKASMPLRKFKLINLEKDRFTLLDKDFTDVRRTYIFKKRQSKFN
ncbi:MAG: hypothetical protein Q7W45_06125 [Bacteroidota bacterium]|nr:hypothetical protein [Bacteroidota bacterium]MDP3145025.1 hypothetical protein [Bacteroidota bacterium]